MSLLGGYKIIDLKDTSLTEEPVKIDGIYDKIENSYRKPLLLSGIVIDGVEKNDAFIYVNVVGNTFTIDIYGGTIIVTSEDEVNYTI